MATISMTVILAGADHDRVVPPYRYLAPIAFAAAGAGLMWLLWPVACWLVPRRITVCPEYVRVSFGFSTRPTLVIPIAELRGVVFNDKPRPLRMLMIRWSDETLSIGIPDRIKPSDLKLFLGDVLRVSAEEGET